MMINSFNIAFSFNFSITGMFSIFKSIPKLCQSVSNNYKIAHNFSPTVSATSKAGFKFSPPPINLHFHYLHKGREGKNIIEDPHSLTYFIRH